MSQMGHSRPSHFVPVLNNVRYASDSDHSRYEFELTLWANSGHRLGDMRLQFDVGSPLPLKAISNWSTR
jgi:hypothetical protein